MTRTRTAALALTALLTVAACGTETETPGAGADSPAGTEEATSGPDGDEDEEATSGPDGDENELLADTRGEGAFFIDSLAVQQAGSSPVQLFLEVDGNAPTPCHTVAYDVEREAETILVHLTTVESTDMMCTQVLVPHEITVPLGKAETFPVTIDVNDGEHVLTVNE
jgi:hypothetical protein